MKTVTLPLDFVKQAHKAACNDWKRRIEEHVPELASIKLEVGKWYRTQNGKGGLWFLEGINNQSDNPHISYGFLRSGEWGESRNRNLIQTTPATDKEVETALIAEAEKRGYIKENFRSLKGNCDTNFDGWYFKESINALYSATLGNGGKVAFWNGKWAEIIPTPIQDKINKLQKQIDKLKTQL